LTAERHHTAAGLNQLERAQILRWMDLNFVEMYRQHVRHVAGGEAHDFESLTVIYGPGGAAIHNPVMVHGPTTAERVLEVAQRCCRALDRKHAIFLRAHADQHLEAPLEAAGYRAVYATPGMYLTRDRFQPVVNGAGLDVRPVATEDEALLYGERVAEAFAIYGIDPATIRSFFERLDAVANPTVQAYVGWQDGEAVTGAILYASHGVAGVGWVWTRPSHFGQRLAEIATSAVLADGFARGLALANLQASPLGQKVYARMGFATPTEYKTLLPVRDLA
jgi:hypothetical protein